MGALAACIHATVPKRTRRRAAATAAPQADAEMKIKRVILDPDPRLRAPNAAVEASWSELEPLVRQMFKIMYSTGHGVGLAAPQVGWNVRLFVMNPDSASKKPAAQRIYWNPAIVDTFGLPMKMREGCLSRPGIFGAVFRYQQVKMRAMTPKGIVEEVLEGLAAQIVQHEVGHLNAELCWERFVAQ